ncbi:hypothetical protein [Pedobacter nanyangensis]|uniref:hypothetical protein n=1 Tax=Pedobacter nanyangensis TaxID=1562389 RepID=UPI0013B37D23|nr:hypothetical protein [Pedobacter nanyangensis]
MSDFFFGEHFCRVFGPLSRQAVFLPYAALRFGAAVYGIAGQYFTEVLRVFIG